MTSLADIGNTLGQNVNEMQKHLEELKRAKGSERGALANKYQKQIKRLKNLLQTYDFTIQDSLDDPEVATHKIQFEEYKQRIKKVEDGIEYSRNAGINQDELFKHRNKNGNKAKNQNGRTQMIEMGDRLQNENLDGVKRALGGIHKMDKMADDINVELDRQIGQLDKIYDDMKDIDTTLKRAEKHLKYFARQVYTDKLLICLVIFIIIAIIAIIVLSIIGKVPGLEIDGLK